MYSMLTGFFYLLQAFKGLKKSLQGPINSGKIYLPLTTKVKRKNMRNFRLANGHWKLKMTLKKFVPIMTKDFHHATGTDFHHTTGADFHHTTWPCRVVIAFLTC